MKIIFKDICFTNLKEKNFKKVINQKGLFLFPSGPGLASINNDKNYYNSLRNSDYVFFDSGFFVLLIKFFKQLSVNKFSGFKFLDFFFNFLKTNKKKTIFCIDPNPRFSKSNKKYLNYLGVSKVYNYIAPKYKKGRIYDRKLIKKLNKLKPDFIMTNIGGGIQEVLGLHLKKNLNFKPTILCTGGAISFFTGDQAPINKFIDKFYLGWFLRLIFNPTTFLKRYLIALKLIPMVLFNKIKIIK